MKSILLSFFLLISSVAEAKEYIGVDSYEMRDILTRSIPSPELIKDLENAYDQLESNRSEDLKNFRSMARDRKSVLIKNLQELKSQMKPGRNGSKFVTGLIRLAERGYTWNLDRVKLMEKKPSFYGVLKDRLTKTLALPEDARLPYWRGETVLRNKILDELAVYEKVSPSLNRYWNVPDLPFRTGFDNASLFNEVITDLPKVLGAARPMTYGGEFIRIPLNLKLDRSCTNIDSYIKDHLYLKVMYDNMKLVQSVFSAPSILDGVLEHNEITVSCREVRESRIQSKIDLSQGHVEVNYYHYDGWCTDGCTRYRFADALEVR